MLSSDGRQRVFKAPTTRDAISGILEAIKLSAASFDMGQSEFCSNIERFGHGSTIGLNALLTGNAAKTVIITTAGFRDTLEIGRMKRQYAGLSELEVTDYYLRGRYPPLIDRTLIYKVPERMDFRGAVIQPLDEGTAPELARTLAKDSVEAVAICTLWATANPAHERRLRDILKEEMPEVYVNASHEICPVVGEHARMSTTAVNAALGPVVGRYLNRLESDFDELGLRCPVLVMTGAGGVVSVNSAAQLPASALLSGPTAGVIACLAMSEQLGKDNALTIDVGGMDFASWCPKAREVYQEGLRIPGVRLVEEGEVRQDILDFILGASRLPAQLGLDLRAFIATINVARDRLTDAIRRYGVETLKMAMVRMLDDAEGRMRQRLMELADGEIEVMNYLEQDGHKNRLYRIALHVTKKGDTLRMDFSNSSPQGPGFINCTRAGMHAGVSGALLPVLGYDMLWNAGMLRPVEVVASDGLICTAQHPPPAGAATVEATWVLCHTTMAALNKLLACSPRYLHRAQAVSTGAMATFNLAGVNQFDQRFGLHLLDPQAGGAGAYATSDGIDASGSIQGPMLCIADVERNEQWAPIPYLYRRIATDSGGIGKKRGGSGLEIALSLSGIQSADALIMTHGLEVPNALGLFGGWPGATVGLRYGRKVLKGGLYPSGPLPEDPAEMGGTWEEYGPKPGHVPMDYEDVFATSWQGGDLGDPLDRDPEAVLNDLKRGIISKQAAEGFYGVVVNGGHLDNDATWDLRQQIREQRINIVLDLASVEALRKADENQ